MYKSLAEAIRTIFGIPYYNGRTKQLLLNYLKDNGLTLSDVIKEKEHYYCKQCGKELLKHQKFCSSSCAATYNNTHRKLSEETKDKISNSLRKRYGHEDRKCWIEKTTGKRKTIKLYTLVCKQCGELFKSKYKNATHCSHKCVANDPAVKEKLRKAQQRLIDEGIHAGWQKRNITSYAEKFWIQVLENNNIPYKREDHSTKHYFLDFLIEKNGKKIDLEIDGKQHNYKDRKAHDSARDKYLTEKGFIVYRVKWNSLLSEIGRNIMREKIENFLNFYNSI